MFFFNARTVLGKQPLQGELPSDFGLFTGTLKIAWPAMLESFFAALITFADTAMVGTLGSYAIASVGLTAQPRLLCLSFFFAVNIACSALVARKKGAGKREEANQVLLHTLFITAVFSVLIGAAAFIRADSILRFAGSKGDTHAYSVMYFRIIIATLLLQTLTLAINAAQRGVGNTKTAMKNNVVSNGLNIIFNYFLIGGHFGFPALGVKGAAIASVIGFTAGFILALHSVLKPDSFLYVLLRNTKPCFNRGIFASMYKVASGAFIEQVFLRIGFFLYAVIVAHLGSSNRDEYYRDFFCRRGRFGSCRHYPRRTKSRPRKKRSCQNIRHLLSAYRFDMFVMYSSVLRGFRERRVPFVLFRPRYFGLRFGYYEDYRTHCYIAGCTGDLRRLFTRCGRYPLYGDGFSYKRCNHSTFFRLAVCVSFGLRFNRRLARFNP